MVKTTLDGASSSSSESCRVPGQSWSIVDRRMAGSWLTTMNAASSSRSWEWIAGHVRNVATGMKKARAAARTPAMNDA